MKTYMTLTGLHSTALRERALVLLSIEREQVAEQLEMIGFEEEKAAPMVVRGRPITRFSTSGLTDRIRRDVA
jgi:hypothetical protein